jgi:serine/threonine protein kinase
MSGVPFLLSQRHQSEPSRLSSVWNNCSDECDGFDCQFAYEDDLPLKLITCLGHGGAGVVTKVQTRTNAFYARKVIRWYGRKKLLLEVQEEVRILRELRHAHIVQIKGSYIVGKASFGFLMEPVADCDLATFLGTFDIETPWSHATRESRVTLSTGFGCLSSALAFIHNREIKHQDIKPQNILVHRGRLLFTDFGIAKDFSSHGVSGSTGSISCTRRVS